jgi:hypothetical protein
VLRREDKRQPAMFGMVHLENTTVFGGCHVHPPWRGEDAVFAPPPFRRTGLYSTTIATKRGAMV